MGAYTFRNVRLEYLMTDDQQNSCFDRAVILSGACIGSTHTTIKKQISLVFIFLLKFLKFYVHGYSFRVIFGTYVMFNFTVY